MKEVKLNDVVRLQMEQLSVEDFYTATFKQDDGKEVSRTSVHLKQDRKTIYPARNMGTGFGDGLFDNPDGNVYEATRHTLMSVPEGATEEQVKAQIEKFADCMIYRILSNKVDDVLGTRYKNALEEGRTDLDTLKARLVVQDGEGNIYANYTTDGEELEEDNRVVGKIIKNEEGKTVGMELTNDKALLEYKVDVFSRSYHKDIDLRAHIAKGTAQEVVAEAAEAEITS